MSLIKNFFSQRTKNSLLEFINFLRNRKYNRFNFFLLILILFFIPTQNYYIKLKIPSGNPVVRFLDIKMPGISFYPVNVNNSPVPNLSALSVLVIDLPEKNIIYAKNPDYRLLPASTTKIMTALVALDKWKLSDVLEVKNNYFIGQIMGLKSGEKMTFLNLLYGLLVDSANDAAYVLAENYPGGLEVFIKAMNKKAIDLNLNETHFTNPAGIENNNHLTTAHDLAILASEAMKNKTFAKIVNTAKITISNLEGKNQYVLENTNKLVAAVLGVKGVKTGWTTNAGECLITNVKRGNKEVMIVVLHSQDRFGETKKIINWVFDNFKWQTIDAIHQ